MTEDEQLVRLATKKANRMHTGYPAIPLYDLILVANRAVEKARKKFNPDRNVPLPNYGAFWIDRALSDEVDRQTAAIMGVSENDLSRAMKVRAIVASEAAADRPALTFDELSEKSGFKNDTLKRVLSICAQVDTYRHWLTRKRE